MQAIISDIHSNIEALSAVLQQMEQLGVKEIYCLGDVIGYGPNPRTCLGMAQNFHGCLRGNHEEALLSSAEDFNTKARQALEWTKDRLNSDAYSWEENKVFWNFVDSLPSLILTDDFMLVHGSPRDRVHEYVTPEDSQNPEKMATLFSLMERPLCFIGHSHIPGVYTEDGRFISPSEQPDGFSLASGARAIVNVGSVGQPRDGDPRSSFVTYENGTIRFHRVEYDVDLTMDKIVATGELPIFLAARLKEGR